MERVGVGPELERVSESLTVLDLVVEMDFESDLLPDLESVKGEPEPVSVSL